MPLVKDNIARQMCLLTKYSKEKVKFMKSKLFLLILGCLTIFTFAAPVDVDAYTYSYCSSSTTLSCCESLYGPIGECPTCPPSGECTQAICDQNFPCPPDGECPTPPACDSCCPPVAGTYSVLGPRGQSGIDPISQVARPTSLDGKRICLIAIGAFRTNESMPILAARLKVLVPSATIVPYTNFTLYSAQALHYPGTARDSVISEIKSQDCDVVISGNGG